MFLVVLTCVKLRFCAIKRRSCCFYLISFDCIREKTNGMSLFIIWPMLGFALLSLATSSNIRVLAVVNKMSESKQYSNFFSDIEGLGATIEYKPAKPDFIQLERFGERLYDLVIIMTGKTQCFGKDSEELTTYLENGGNAYVFNNPTGSDIQNHLYRYFNLHVIPSQTIGDVLGNSKVVLRKILAPKAIVSGKIAPLLYEGGFGTIERPNDFRIPIVVGGIEHHLSAADKLTTSQSIANEMIPIYALQSRKGGRVVFVHSSTFASDASFEEKVELAEDLSPLKDGIENGNRALLIQLSQWVSHYKSHVKIVSATHFDEKTLVAPVQYHINQNITVVAQLSYVNEGEWIPYTEEDVQVEVFMLGVFVRRHMKLVQPGQYKETIMLPDRAGNFKIKVFTSKDGWMNAREEMAIAIRPLAIREKAKFLHYAEPYQVSMMVIMGLAFLASVHFLYHKPSDK